MYTIKHAAELTGLPVATLRAWERRYGIVAPQRTDSGYRLYDEECVRRLRSMQQLVQSGWSPQQAAAEVKLRQVVGRDTSVAVPPAGHGGPVAEGTRSAPQTATPAAGELADAATALDPRRLSAVLDEQFSRASFESIVDGWLMAAVAEVGRGWADGRVTVAGEHLVAAAVMRRLAAAFEAAGHDPRGTDAVVGLPPGVHHEIGILAFAVAARRAGVAVSYVGADLPVDSWVEAVGRHQARAAVLAVPRSQDLPAAGDVVGAVARAHPEVTVFVGGSRQDDVAAPAVPLGHRIGPAAEQLARHLALTARASDG